MISCLVNGSVKEIKNRSKDHENTKRWLVNIDPEPLQTRGRPMHLWIHPTLKRRLRVVVTLCPIDRKINKKN